MALNVLNTDDACHRCIKQYACKHKLKKGASFEVDCNGIPQNYIADETAALLPSSQNAEILLDPVKWAAEVLDWHCLDPDGEVWERKNPEERYRQTNDNPGRASKFHRPYQADMLRCTSKRKVFRIGRQAGKCLPSGTLIQMADGTQKPVELVEDGDLVVSMNDNYQNINTPAFRACNGEKPVAKIVLMDGREVEATYNHPFLTRSRVGRETTGTRRAIFHDEWKPVEELTTDSYIAVPRNITVFEGADYGKHIPTLVGCMIADGNLTSKNCRFSNTNPVILAAFKEAVESAGGFLKQYPSDADSDYHVVGTGPGRTSPVRNLFRELNLWGLDSHQKYIPDAMMQMTESNTVDLLRAMFGCDGWASVCADGGVEIGYSTVSEKLAQQVVALLMRFGVYSTMQTKTVKLDGKKYLSRQLTITRKQSVSNFCKKIGILGKGEAVKRVYEVSQLKNASFKTEAYEDDDLVFIKVRSIESVGTKMTWDLSVPETKNFIANNILTHNTESLVISMLFAMFTNTNFKIVLITPFQSQIDLIFKRLEELIKSQPALQNSIRRNVKAPQYSMELYNGSYVKGFTAGTKSGSGAASARGQPANMLVFDEADYLNPNDMDAAMAIITNYPDATVWMSSTPSGKREKFYDACKDKEWKEFHLPSSVNPNWNAKLQRFFHKTLTDIGYKHEVLADFGEQEEGVFQIQYVEAAQAEYTYESVSPQPSWLYSVGVDWNSPAVGTTIRVVGFNPANNKFYLVDRKTVQRAGHTQIAACEAIAEMNRKWRPFVIYVDRGYGATQIEILHTFGYESMSNPEKGPKHLDSRLARIVKAYDFGSKVETRDPFTKQIVNKPAKGFLVENSVRRFEAGDFFFPEEDEQMAEELMGYIVKNVTPTGQFVYGTNSDSIGDHNLDALMLALVGFTLEKTAFGKPGADEGIKFSRIMGNAEESALSREPAASYMQQSQASKPGSGRSEFSTVSTTPHGHRSNESLPSWTEPPDREAKTPYISNRSDVPQTKRGVSFRRGGRGGPPRRKNI